MINQPEKERTVSPEDPSIDWSLASIAGRGGGGIAWDCILDEICFGSIERRRCLDNYLRSNPKDSNMTIWYAHLVVSRYIKTVQVNQKILFPDSPTLFRTFNYPGYADNKRLRVAHKSAQNSIRRTSYSISMSTNLYFVRVLIKPFLYTICVQDCPARPIILWFQFNQ